MGQLNWQAEIPNEEGAFFFINYNDATLRCTDAGVDNLNDTRPATVRVYDPGGLTPVFSITVSPNQSLTHNFSGQERFDVNQFDYSFRFEAPIA